jgi:PAS domain S-box-containing protein
MSEEELRRELRRTKRFLELVLEVGEMNGAIVDRDRRHTWVHNDASEPPEDEIIGKTDAELFSEEMAAPTTRLKRAAMETESRVQREFTFVKPSGPNRYRAAAEPIYDADEEVAGAMFGATDLSDRYRYLTRTTDGVYTVDSDWEVTFWNEQMARRTGVEPEDVVGRSLWEVFGESIPDDLEARYREVMESGEPAEFEKYLPEPFDYWVEIRAFADEDGLSVYSRDVTERKSREERLERQRDTLEVLNQVLRHDIRNDLQLVTTYAELLADEVDGGETTQEYTEHVADSAEHAIELTKTAGEISEALFADEHRVERVSLRTVLEREIEGLRDGHPGASVLVDGPIPDVAVVADDMLNSVWRNLLTNAVVHSDEAVPEVRVSTEDRDDEIVVRIADNGPGVPDTDKEEVFGKGRKRLDSQGTGMGLYLVRTLVERYGGSVWVEDNDPEGTVFSVALAKATDGRGDRE